MMLEKNFVLSFPFEQKDLGWLESSVEQRFPA
jgi:hypothetical protein